MTQATADDATPLQDAGAGQQVPISETDRKEIERLYEAFRRGKAKLVSPSGETRLLPESLYGFLAELVGLLNEGKSVMLVQNQANLTTVEAATMLGVSRQFLVNLLEKGRSRIIWSEHTGACTPKICSNIRHEETGSATGLCVNYLKLRRKKGCTSDLPVKADED